MSVVWRREPTDFWRRARRDGRRSRQPVPPKLPPGAVVWVPERGDVFVRYVAGPPGAPTVLLLHGWMASADLNWLGTFQALAGRYHVLAMDLRGHGRGIRTSEDFTLEDCVEDAAGLVRQLDLRDVIVGGYSMGGLIALALAREHPELVQGLILVASAAELCRTGHRRAMRPYADLLSLAARVPLTDRLVRRAGRSGPVWGGMLADLAPWLTGELRRLHPADIRCAGHAIARFDARPWVHELDVPAASVVTTRDRSVPPERQRETADALGADVVEVDAGHTACVTDPEELGTGVRDAVDRVVSASRAGWLARAPLTRGALSRTALGRVALIRTSRSNGSSHSTEHALQPGESTDDGSDVDTNGAGDNAAAEVGLAEIGTGENELEPVAPRPRPLAQATARFARRVS
jgi:3-oxoadipate enol-lactonase